MTAYKNQNFFGNPSVVPTFGFLFQELQHGEDVELLFGFYRQDAAGLTRVGGHYVTLTGLDWDDVDGDLLLGAGEANMTFIDPATGAPATPSLHNQAGFLRTSYGEQPGFLTFIEAAVSESPVPEPPVWLMLLTALGGLAMRRRRWTGRRRH